MQLDITGLADIHRRPAIFRRDTEEWMVELREVGAVDWEQRSWETRRKNFDWDIKTKKN